MASNDESPASAGLELEDNRLAVELVGPYNRNLSLIERAFGVTIEQRGNVLTVRGEAAAAAEGVIRSLWAGLKAGGHVDAEEVRAALRMAQAAPGEAVEAGEIRTQRKSIKGRTPQQGAYLRALARSELVFGVGPAGTGKTYLAVAAAVSAFLERRVDRIILSRPAVEAGERLGFLPGDLKDKIDPYLRPLYDALHDMMPGDRVTKALETGAFEVAPLAFMRGRTLHNAFVVLDEAQNTTTMQMKMFLTRLGEGSRMAVTGDPSQVDLPPGQQSGLREALRILRGVKGVEMVRFSSADVVRHPLVGRIVEAYDADAAARRARERGEADAPLDPESGEPENG